MMANAPRPEVTRPPLPATSSARISTQANAPALRLPDTLETSKEKVSGSGHSEELSGSGYNLPDLEHLQWESNGKGGFEAWHSPTGVNHRKGKTYLGFLGKRQIAKWEREETPGRFKELVVEWIAEKKAAKGI